MHHCVAQSSTVLYIARYSCIRARGSYTDVFVRAAVTTNFSRHLSATGVSGSASIAHWRGSLETDPAIFTSRQTSGVYIGSVADAGFLQGGCGSWCLWNAPIPFIPSLPPTLKKISCEPAARLKLVIIIIVLSAVLTIFEISRP